MTEAIEPFSIHVEDAVLDDLRRRLAATQFPDEIDGTAWEYGIPLAYVRELVDYWRDTYDWRAQERRLNEYPQFHTPIDGQRVHFIHARSTAADAFPLILIHGWPGSIVEFFHVIPRLTDAFHVVIPSLPGYGFSGPTHERGWDTTRIARALAELMARLGYARYGTQGGDWGAQIATRMGALDAAHCAAIHINMPMATRPKEDVTLSDEDQSGLAALARFQQEESGYAIEQGTKPQTLGFALADSPAGLLAWIVEKFHGWSDPETVFSREQLITNVMIYWVTQTITSSMRLYREHRTSKEPQQHVGVPTGVARYPHEVLRLPRPWIERAYNVTYWNDMPRGGHFAAMEQPQLFADDVRAFFSTAR